MEPSLNEQLRSAHGRSLCEKAEQLQIQSCKMTVTCDARACRSLAITTVQGGPKNVAHCFVRRNFTRLNLSNIDRFSNLLHCLNQENIVVILSLKIQPYLKCVATQKSTSVTTRLKKLTAETKYLCVYCLGYYLE